MQRRADSSRRRLLALPTRASGEGGARYDLDVGLFGLLNGCPLPSDHSLRVLIPVQELAVLNERLALAP